MTDSQALQKTLGSGFHNYTITANQSHRHRWLVGGAVRRFQQQMKKNRELAVRFAQAASTL